MPNIRRSLLSAAIMALALLAAACGSNDGADAPASEVADATTTTQAKIVPPSSTAPTTTVAEIPLDAAPVPPTDYAGFRNQETACGAEAPPERDVLQYPSPDDLGLDPASRPIAVISTSCGDITVELDPSLAPATVNSFVFLAEAGYFDGTVSHRVAPGFVLQAGDPTGTGRGGPGYTIPDEFPPTDFLYERGVLAMANAGAGTTGSQFFIMLADAGLPPQFSVFGTVVAGLDVLDTIATIPLGVGPTGEQSVPLQTLYLNSVAIER